MAMSLSAVGAAGELDLCLNDFVVVCLARSYCVAEDGFKIAILLPLASKCWDYRYMSPHQAFLCSITLVSLWNAGHTVLRKKGQKLPDLFWSGL